MAIGVQVVIDCADPGKLAPFWAEALHYKLQDPPEGFASWQDWLRASNIPESDWNSASAVIDPEGVGPRIYFQRVPEGKTVKNRVHLDLSVGSRHDPPEVKQAKVAAEVDRLEALGARKLQARTVRGVYFVNMLDPEGNEFDVQ